MGKRSRKGGYIDPLLPTKRVHYNFSAQTTIPVGSTSDTLTPETSKELSNAWKTAARKESAIRCAIGPSSVGERHYPQSIFLKPKEEVEDEDEKE